MLRPRGCSSLLPSGVTSCLMQHPHQSVFCASTDSTHLPWRISSSLRERPVSFWSLHHPNLVHSGMDVQHKHRILDHLFLLNIICFPTLRNKNICTWLSQFLTMDLCPCLGMCHERRHFYQNLRKGVSQGAWPGLKFASSSTILGWMYCFYKDDFPLISKQLIFPEAGCY